MITEKQQAQQKPELFEMLEKIDQATGRQEIIELVQKYSKVYQSFNDYLRCVFDDSIQFLLPAGKPPYTPAHEAHYPSTWHKQHLQLKMFVKGLGYDEMNQIKRESRFIEILESINPEDAVHISALTDKKCNVSGLTKELVSEALPNLIAK